MSIPRIIARCAFALSLALAAQSSVFADGEEPEQPQEPEDSTDEPLDDGKDYAEPGAWKIIGGEGPQNCPVKVGQGVIIQIDTHRHGNGPLEVGGKLSGTADRYASKIAASGLEVQLKVSCATAPNEEAEILETAWLPIYQSRVDGEISCPPEKPVLMGFGCQTRTNKGWDAATPK